MLRHSPPSPKPPPAFRKWNILSNCTMYNTAAFNSYAHFKRSSCSIFSWSLFPTWSVTNECVWVCVHWPLLRNKSSICRSLLRLSPETNFMNGSEHPPVRYGWHLSSFWLLIFVRNRPGFRLQWMCCSVFVSGRRYYRNVQLLVLHLPVHWTLHTFPSVGVNGSLPNILQITKMICFIFETNIKTLKRLGRCQFSVSYRNSQTVCRVTSWKLLTRSMISNLVKQFEYYVCYISCHRACS